MIVGKILEWIENWVRHFCKRRREKKNKRIEIYKKFIPIIEKFDDQCDWERADQRNQMGELYMLIYKNIKEIMTIENKLFIYRKTLKKYDKLYNAILPYEIDIVTIEEHANQSCQYEWYCEHTTNDEILDVQEECREKTAQLMTKFTKQIKKDNKRLK